MWKRVSPWLAVSATLLVCAAAPKPSCPNPPIPIVSSSAVPVDVCVPSNFNQNPIAFFDDYSWRAFVALVWPAKSGQRGTPDPAKKVGSSGTRVFETYKSLYETFHLDGSAPTAWNQFDPPKQNPCGVQEGFNDITLASFTKFADVGQAGFGTLIGPLVAQNKTYVRFMTGFDKTEFTQIASNRWYLRANLPKTLTFQTGALDVKSSWIEMAGVAHPERYYTRTAWVKDPYSGKCAHKTVGLVGLHIVQKTPSRPQWIWSTFEQVDNLTSTFNDGSGMAMPTSNPYSVAGLPPAPPKPYNVSRIRPIHSSTQATNAAYQKLLAGTPWQFYQLVMTQWPLAVSSPKTIATPQNTFPGNNADTAFANATMETFDQASIFTGCMSCHAATQQATDLVWALKDHAFPADIPVISDPQLQQLQGMLTQSKIPDADVKRTAAKKDE
ncbi:MAG TPA: hypothetical protein VI670_03690 [Thermoanaerobaculia bacterium]|jgi:hypothetical protein